MSDEPVELSHAEELREALLNESIKEGDPDFATRRKMIEQNEDHPDVEVLKSVTGSLFSLIQGEILESDDYSKIDWPHLGSYIKRWGYHPPAMMLWVAEMLTQAFDNAIAQDGNKPDPDEIELFLVKSGVAEQLSRMAHVLFLAGALEHQRHTSLVAELLMNKEPEQDADEASQPSA